MPTLREILDSNNEVILDGSVERQSTFLWEIFESKDYSQLNSKDIISEISSFQEFLEAFEHPNARTTPEITREIRTYAEKLGEKTSYLKGSIKFHKHKTKNPKKRNRRQKLIDSSHSISLNQELLETLQKRVFHAYQISRGKELEIGDSDYEKFAGAIIQIERLLHLKQDTGYFIGKHDKDKTHYSDTDERITATILWQSMFSNQSPVLVTKDKDFVRLLGTLPKLLGSDIFLPYNQLFRKRMTENPFKLYCTNQHNQDNYQYHLDNGTIVFLPEFQSDILSKRITQESEKRVKEFWEQFSQSKP